MSPDKLSVLLGRPLSATETTNFNTYVSLAQSRVSDMLCSEICPASDTKSFELSTGYRTLNLPIFTSIISITVDGDVLDEATYMVKQGDNLNGNWFNAVEFDSIQACKTVVIDADWGFREMPLDVQQMVAEQFGIMSSALDSDQITRKQVEDFSVTFQGTVSDAFAKKYAPAVAKYSACRNNTIVSGRLNRHWGYDYGRVQFL
jgi:hypothetical protein